MRPIKSNVNRIVTRPYQTLRTPWAFHLDHMIDGTVPKINPTSTMDPTVFKLNRKPSHKDIKMSLIVAVSNWDWKMTKNTILKSVNKIEKNKNAFISCWIPCIQFNQQFIPFPNFIYCLQIYTKYTNIYILYLLHRGPLHRLHFPQPLSVVFCPWSSMKSTVSPFLWTFWTPSSRLFLNS